MAVNREYLAYVLDQLAGVGRLRTRRMFGAAGLYCGEQFFAIIADDTLYFRVDDANRGEYESRSMSRFRPYRDRPELSMSYYEVPAEVLEDSGEAVAWAAKAVRAAMTAAAARTRPVSSRRPKSRSTRSPAAARKIRTRTSE